MCAQNKDGGKNGGKRKDGRNIEWDMIIRRLEEWRGGLEEPSVTTIAGLYKKDAWAVLASTILSLRTKDAVTLKASKKLLAAAPSAQDILNLTETEIQELIYPAGFYKTKAANLKKISAILVEKYNGRPPASMEELLALPGVGRKTANLTLIEAYDMDGICVDVHVHRISGRLGWTSEKTPDDTEMALREIMPRMFWKRINALLVLYGQNVCRPVSPHCGSCVISAYCENNLTAS
ncbi:MAG: endonuclease III [Spirochaetaceae bacterium]|jgi:endonuclease-3|nr:endonuclease III [Spirochaetaceae bacterium]